jgi:hypothetical protein
MKVVYIIGPFRAPTAWEIEENVRRAERLALEVARLGAMPLCSHTNTRFFQGQCSDQFWIDGTLVLLRRSDAAITVDGWEKSSGSRGEVEDNIKQSRPVFHTIPGLKKWLDRRQQIEQFDHLPFNLQVRHLTRCPTCEAPAGSPCTPDLENCHIYTCHKSRNQIARELLTSS